MLEILIDIDPKRRTEFGLFVVAIRPKSFKVVKDDRYIIYIDKDITEKQIRRACTNAGYPFEQVIYIRKIEEIPDCLISE